MHVPFLGASLDADGNDGLEESSISLISARGIWFDKNSRAILCQRVNSGAIDMPQLTIRSEW